jgi:type I restriction enzyme S subunit
MTDDWQVRLLGDLTDNFDSARVPVKGTDRRSGPYAYYGASGIVDHVDDYIFDGEYLLIAEDGENLRTRNTPIAFLASGKFWVNNHAHIVRGNSKADTRFLMYALAVADISGYLTGSTMPKLTQGNLNRIPIVTPSLGEQRAIVKILSSLDDKIQLNRKMSQTLDATALTLYKSWFVDFDPVRAKAEGRLTGLPHRIANLFPSTFEQTDVGLVPSGWRHSSIGEICKRVAMGPFGSDIKTDNFVDAGVPIIRGSNLTNGFVENDFVFLSESKADELRNANAFPGDIVITHRGTLGQVGLIPPSSRYSRYVVSQSQMLLSIDPQFTTARYVFDFLRSADGQHALLANTSQTGVPAIARPTTSLKAIQIVAPPIDVLTAFDEFVGEIYSRRDNCVEETRSLVGLRDALLPKLMSGMLQVSRS